jgi:MraZ protein
MFLGEFIHSLDEKSRLALPAKFRARLADGVVMTAGSDKCLLVYPLDEFKLLFERVSALPVLGKEAASLRRMLFSNAHDAIPDKQNRVVIPQPLREFAEITNEVVLVGVGKFIEVWAPRAWEQAKQEVREDAARGEVWGKLGI